MGPSEIYPAPLGARQALKTSPRERAAKVRSGLAPEGTAHVQRGGGEIPPFKKKKPNKINERARNAGC